MDFYIIFFDETPKQRKLWALSILKVFLTYIFDYQRFSSLKAASLNKKLVNKELLSLKRACTDTEKMIILKVKKETVFLLFF